MDWVVIGDVSGHGVPAGLIMMMAQTSINVTLVQNPDLHPSELLSIVNETITKNIQKMGEDKYMTITVIAVAHDGKLMFSGLHQDIMIYRVKEGEIELIETHGMWLGLMDDAEGLFVDENLMMDVGDVMLIYTDGITEAWKKGISKDDLNENDIFGEDRLIDTFKELGDLSPEEIKDGILRKLNKNYISDDDVTLVVMKRK